MAVRRDPLLERALLESSAKYGPQGTVLRQMLSELASSYTRGRRVAASNELGIKQAAHDARPDVSSAFDTALTSVSAQRAALGASVDPQAAAYERRVSDERANALNDLTQREVRATEGRIYANDAARSDYLGGKAKIIGQLQDLVAQQGADTASTYGKLRDAQLQRGIQRRGQTLSHRDRQASLAVAQQNADTAAARAQQAAKDKAAGKSGVKWATPQQHGAAKSDISRAVSYVNTLKTHIKSRSKLIQTLIQGVPASKDLVVDAKGKPVLDAAGKPKYETLPAIPAMDPDYVRAAMNIAFDGSLSRGDLQRLHNRGLQTRRLGYQVRPPQALRPNGAAQMAGRGGGPSLSRRPPVAGLNP
jgi:hypothetical protein